MGRSASLAATATIAVVLMVGYYILSIALVIILPSRCPAPLPA
jgi:hypothetical protein